MKNSGKNLQADNLIKFWINVRFVNVSKNHIPVKDNCGNEFVLLKLKNMWILRIRNTILLLRKNKTEACYQQAQTFKHPNIQTFMSLSSNLIFT
jgi:hypothetical protein